MSIARLKDEYLAAAKRLRERVCVLTEQYKQARKKEQSMLRRRITCLYLEIRELINTANSIIEYCSRNAIEEV